MQRAHESNPCVRFFLVAALLLPAAGYTQEPDASAGTPGEADPYMPRVPAHNENFPGIGFISWQYPTNPRFNLAVPIVLMGGHTFRRTDYLGFMQGEGSYIENRIDGGIYVFNDPAHTLVKKYGSFNQIPLATIAAMRNSQVAYVLPKNQRSYPPPDGAQRHAGPEPDPNLPIGSRSKNDPILWIYSGTGYPQVASNRYLGFNDEGSWLVGEKARHVGVWNIGTRTYTIRYHAIGDVPRNLLLSLRNAQINDLLGIAPQAAPAKSAAPPPAVPSPTRQATVFGDTDAMKNALGSLQTGAGKTGAPTLPAQAGAGRISGSGASISGGVLTFTSASGSQASYHVVRAKTGAPAGAGIAGAWIAASDKLLLNVQSDGTVTGMTVPDAVLQMWTPH
jgi:hypothetical protein